MCLQDHDYRGSLPQSPPPVMTVALVTMMTTTMTAVNETAGNHPHQVVLTTTDNPW